MRFKIRGFNVASILFLYMNLRLYHEKAGTSKVFDIFEMPCLLKKRRYYL